jgi:hypothetical protein
MVLRRADKVEGAELRRGWNADGIAAHDDIFQGSVAVIGRSVALRFRRTAAPISVNILPDFSNF